MEYEDSVGQDAVENGEWQSHERYHAHAGPLRDFSGAFGIPSDLSDCVTDADLGSLSDDRPECMTVGSYLVEVVYGTSGVLNLHAR